MKKVGFIGGYDKTNIIMCVAKLLNYLDYRVIVVDTTTLQKMRYVVPSISPTKSYMAELDKIDFAVGFQNMNQLERYLEIPEINMPYDYMLIDIDSFESLEGYGLQDIEGNFFITGFDIYSLRKGISILERLQAPLKLNKVLCRYELLKEDEEYFNYLTIDCKVNWDDFSIYIPCTDEDNQVLEENQKTFRIRIKRLSINFQEGLMYIVQKILGESNIGRIKKSIKE